VRVWDTLHATSVAADRDVTASAFRIGQSANAPTFSTLGAGVQHGPDKARLSSDLWIMGGASISGDVTATGGATFAQGATATSGGFYGRGALAGAPLVGRVDPKTGAFTSAITDDATGALHIVNTVKNAPIAFSFVDPATGKPSNTLVSRPPMGGANKGGTWVRDSLSVTHGDGLEGVRLVNSGQAEFISPVAVWRAGVWAKAKADTDRFVIERNARGKSATPILTASPAGVGIMLPRDVDPAAALDVRGDARLSGKLCIGTACVTQPGLAAIAALPQQQATLSQQVAQQRVQISSQGTTLSQVQGSVSTQSKTLSGLQQQSRGVAEQVAALQGQIAALQQQLQQGQQQDQQVQKLIQQQVAALQQHDAQMQQMQQQQQPQQPQQPQQLYPMLDYDASTLPSALVGTPVTSWPNTGALSGSSYAALGSGNAVPTLVASPPGGKSRPYVALTATGSFAIPGSISWSLQSSGASFVAVLVARINRTSAASTLVEFASGPLANSLLLAQDGAGQLVGAFYGANGGSPDAQTATTVPGGVIATAQWAVYAVRVTPNADKAGGYSITLYVNGVASTTGAGTAPLSDRVTSVNLINQSSAGSGGSTIDIAEIQVYDAPMTDTNVAQISQAMTTKWIS
jgi:hypothetical protein